MGYKKRAFAKGSKHNMSTKTVLIAAAVMAGLYYVYQTLQDEPGHVALPNEPLNNNNNSGHTIVFPPAPPPPSPGFGFISPAPGRLRLPGGGLGRIGDLMF
jgi:hypothetical protein